MDELVDRLKAKQEQLGFKKQGDFARWLGISDSKLSKLYSGDQGIGSRTLEALWKRCPDIFLPTHMQIVHKEGQQE